MTRARPTARVTTPHQGGSALRARPSVEFVQGVARCFAVISTFGPDAPTQTISSVAQRAGFTRSVARRYLLTLRALGYVTQNGPLFAITPRVLDLGATYLATLDVARVAQPFMEAVVEQLHESCSAAVLDGADIVYVARVPARRIMSVNLVLGSRLPAHATAIGKAILANLPSHVVDEYLRTAPLHPMTRHTITDPSVFRRSLGEVRRKGWAMAIDESEIGVRSVAAPIFNHGNQVAAAINVAGHASRLTMKALRTVCLPVLLETVERVSRALGASHGSGLARDRAVAVIPGPFRS